MLNKPLVGVTADTAEIGMHPAHVVGDKYLRAVIEGAAATAVIVPALGAAQPSAELVAAFDGLLFTGSASNIEPHWYRGALGESNVLHDPARDATTLPLMRAAIDAGVPVLAICRGFQEMNVAYGGTLHQRVHEVDGRNDHRENKADPLELQYGPAHRIELVEGGLLHTLLGDRTPILVNSLHTQGIDALAPGLVVEAFAQDGLIEAIRPAGARMFALGVQWHPEWKRADAPLSSAIFSAFGAACRERRTRRIAPDDRRP
jgi:putative glutamine amidotransferase